MRPDRDWIDIGTVIVLALAFFAAAYAAKEGERLSNATIDATARADFAARAQHLDTLAALKRADDANAIAKATADRQAQDTASALALSKKAVDAAQQSARLVRDNFIIDRRPYVWLTNDLGAPELKRLPNGSLQVIWPWYFTNYGTGLLPHQDRSLY